MKNLLIDTDPGMDDALAIALAHKSGALDVKAITVGHRQPAADRTAANALKILDLLGAPDDPCRPGTVDPQSVGPVLARQRRPGRVTLSPSPAGASTAGVRPS